MSQNNQRDKIRVAVLYGGRSGEHEVSLRSATSVIRNLDRSRFEIIPIGIDKQGTWFLGDDLLPKQLTSDEGVLKLTKDSSRMLFSPDQFNKQVQVRNLGALIPTASAGRMFDVVFPVIHGTLCEDGTVQGLLELAELPYVGSGVLSSAVTMDKDVSKRLAMNAGINVARYLTVKQGQWQKNSKAFCDLVNDELSYPVFVKPANTGSSVGIKKVKLAKDLRNAIEYAFRFDTKVIVEQGINAIELEVAVLESLKCGEDPIVSVVGEVRPIHHEFYSYQAKYLDEDGTELLIPAPISETLAIEVRETAKRLFSILECEAMARVDLFLERDTNKIYFNEINSIPGFTNISMYPKLMDASGISYSELLTHLVELAFERHSHKSKLCHEYQEDN